MSTHIDSLATKSFASHQITRRHDSELLRWYCCQKPGTWIYGFHVTFTPGWVFISGDIGHLALCRMDDMLPWLRSVFNGAIDFRYIAEKAPTCITTRRWTAEAAQVAVYACCEDLGISREAASELAEGFSDEYEWNSIVVPKLFEMGGPLECNPTDWAPEFLWCVYGLRTFVRLIDEEV